MGSYTFTWAHPASEVYVSGDFDDWKKTIKLEQEDGVFKKTVELPKTKHQYKFVVDGEWLTNDSHPKEEVNGTGIYNNVLHPEEIQDPVSTLSSAAPESSTAALAAEVPKEEKPSTEKPKSPEDYLPGSFPMTPPAATPGTEQTFSVNPIPATDGPGNPVQLAPGEKVPDPSTLTSNTVQSTVKDDKPEEETVSVAPIPATAGAGNPIHLAPGEKVPDPSTLTSNTISSTVKTDEASYEKSDALPQQGSVASPESEKQEKGGMFSLPSVAGSLIPESSLPKEGGAETEKDPGVTIQSAAPTSTTAALAGQVPKEPRGVPSAVVDSQKEAHFPPEASANPEAVEEKKEVEAELKEKIPEQPAESDGSPTVKQGGASTAGTISSGDNTFAAGAFAAATYAAKEKAAELVGLNGQATASGVPDVVSESQKEAHASPEASANPEAVQEKKEVEAELLKQSEQGTGADSAVPDVVAESQKEAHASPEASANPEAVEEKKEVEAELLKEVKTTNEAGEPAPTITAATTETAPGPSDDTADKDGLNAPASKPAQSEVAQPAIDSRDVSPMSKPATQTQPIVTTGVESSKTEAKTAPETPKKDKVESAKGTPESSAPATTDKKNKRRSFFGKLKDKLKDL